MRLGVVLASVLCVAICPFRLCAERPPQDRNSAHVILIGLVEDVTETWDLQTDYYKVRLRVIEVDKRSTDVPGEHFEATCFRWSRPPPRYVGAAGHKGVPAIGDRVRVYAYRRGNSYEGAYPDWFDLLQPSSHNWLARQWDSRKVRVASFAALIVASVVFGALLARRRRTRSVKLMPPGLPERSGDADVPPVDRSPK